MKLKPISEIKTSLGIDPNGPVQAFFTDTCYKHMDKYVPMDTGDLRNIVDKGIDYITYESNYAEYQYKGQREDGTHKVKNYSTPGTGPYWDKKMVSAEINDVVKEVQEFVNRNK